MNYTLQVGCNSKKIDPGCSNLPSSEWQWQTHGVKYAGFDWGSGLGDDHLGKGRKKKTHTPQKNNRLCDVLNVPFVCEGVCQK